jgi:DNA-binding transcriptional MocR family regulator
MIKELDKLSKYGVTYSKPNGGLNFWVTLPHGLEATKLYLECAKKDLLIVPCKIFYVNNYRNSDNTIRLSFAATNEHQIKEGMSILEDCIIKLSSNSTNRKYFSPMI